MRRSNVNYANVVRKKLDALSQNRDEDLDIFFEVAHREFCVALQSMSLDLMDSLDRGLDSLGSTLARLESSTRKVISTRDNHALAREIEAKFSAEQERAEKTLLSMWLQGFVYRLPKAAAQSAHDHAQQVGLGLDAVDFAFSRYALNIAISSSNVSKEKIISSRVPGIIVSMLDGANATMALANAEARGQIQYGFSWTVSSDAAALVSGPCLMALAHLARRDAAMCSEITAASGILVIVNSIKLGHHPAVLTQACLALGALALLPRNRVLIAEANGVNILIRLLAIFQNSGRVLDESDSCSFEATCQDSGASETIQGAALVACTNLMNSSESNRQLIAELGGVPPIVACILFARSGSTVRNAAYAIANLAYRSNFTIARCMMERVEVAICAAIGATDYLREDRLLEAAYRALANLALGEATQTGLAASDAMIWCVRGLFKCSYVHVLRAAAHATAAIAYKCRSNKARFAQLGALAACVRIVDDFGTGSLEHTEKYLSAVHAASLAACTLLSFRPNHILFEDCCGVDTYSLLCHTTEHMELLTVGAMAIASVAPTALDRWEALSEGRLLYFEQTAGLDALVRCAKWNFSRSEPPRWLEGTIQTLQMSRSQIQQSLARPHRNELDTGGNTELFTREVLFEEVLAPIHSDHITSHSLALRDLAFRLF